MNTRCNQGLVAMLLLGTMGFGTIHAQPPAFSSFEYNQASNTVFLEWLNSTNAFYEMQASTNLTSELWGQEGGWTNILGTNPTNSVILPANGHSSAFFRLLTRKNSPQYSYGGGIALRANANLLASEYPQGNYGDAMYFWDQNTQTYSICVFGSLGGWSSRTDITNNQSFYYMSHTDPLEIPSEFSSFAHAKDWRIITPGDLPVTGNVLIEWSAFDSYSTPSNPGPEIPIVDITIRNSDYMIITNWSLFAPVSSSTIWNSHGNPAGYYDIEVYIGGEGVGIGEIYKEVYLYN